MLEPQNKDDLIAWGKRFEYCMQRNSDLLTMMLTAGDAEVMLNTTKANDYLDYLELWVKDNIVKYERQKAKKEKEKSKKKTPKK